jgi:phosphoenolpyruvate carboxylase
MEKDGGTLPDDKDADAVKKYFQKVYPDMDFERVYSSDMKKMVKWFDVLKKNNVEIKLPEVPEEEQQVEEVKEEPVTDEPKEKTTKKKKTE